MAKAKESNDEGPNGREKRKTIKSMKFAVYIAKI
jgi:hypothetical protein